ncbi:MAG TPA: hypothetical protein PKL83_02195 [bacterium]|nr:hypothetical protein [bacterium]
MADIDKQITWQDAPAYPDLPRDGTREGVVFDFLMSLVESMVPIDREKKIAFELNGVERDLIGKAACFLSQGDDKEIERTIEHVYSHRRQLIRMVELGIVSGQEITFIATCSMLHDICKTSAAIKRLGSRIRGFDSEEGQSYLGQVLDAVLEPHEAVYTTAGGRSVDRKQSILNTLSALGGAIERDRQNNGFEALALHEMASALVLVSLCFPDGIVLADPNFLDRLPYIRSVLNHRGRVAFLDENMIAFLCKVAVEGRKPQLIQVNDQDVVAWIDAVPQQKKSATLIDELANKLQKGHPLQESDKQELDAAFAREKVETDPVDPDLAEALARIAPDPVTEAETALNAMDVATFSEVRGMIKITIEAYDRAAMQRIPPWDAIDLALVNFTMPFGSADQLLARSSEAIRYGQVENVVMPPALIASTNFARSTSHYPRQGLDR